MGLACCGPAARVSTARPAVISLALNPIRRAMATSLGLTRAMKSRWCAGSGVIRISSTIVGDRGVSSVNLAQIKCDRTVAYGIELEPGQGLVIVSRRGYEFRERGFRFADAFSGRVNGGGSESPRHGSSTNG